MASEHTCPYCHKDLVSWEPPDEAGWDHDLMVCENNECSYFVKGEAKSAKTMTGISATATAMTLQTGNELPILAWCGGDLSLLKGRCKEVCEG